MTYAFVQGVSGIVSNVYRIPLEETIVENDTIRFSFPLPEKDGTKTAATQGDSEVFAPHVENMLGEGLKKLFESAHKSGCDQLRITLESKPVSSQFIRLHAVPNLTSREIEEDPTCTATVLDDIRAGNVLAVVEHYLPHPGKATSVAAEVKIICEEKFQVTDAETGVVLQGSEGVPATNLVCHVVTFETQIRYDEQSWLERKNWQLIDIDDLVSTKKWFQF